MLYINFHIYAAQFILYTNVFNLVQLPTKMKPIAFSLIYECMNKNLAEKLPQCQLRAVNPNTTPFAVLDQYGGVEPIILPKKLDCIKFLFSTPQNIGWKHHRNNLKPILHLHDQYHSHTHANLLTYVNDFSSRGSQQAGHWSKLSCVTK